MKKPDPLVKLYTRLDALSQRERVIILVTLMAALLLVWDNWFLEGQLQSRSAQQQQLSTLQTQQQMQATLRDQLQAGMAQDPNSVERQRLARYQSEIDRIDALLKEKTLEFISPQQMVEVLKNLMHEDPGLKLAGLESTRPQLPLRDDADEAAGKAADAGDDDDAAESTPTPTVYLHGVEMHFRGDFFSVLHYVQRLESLKWRFAWDALRISLDDYPVVDARIRLETLSLTEGWIGV